MSICFEKARELGNLILTSEQSIMLADATAEFKKHPEAQQKLDEYQRYQNNYRESMEIMSPDERQTVLKRMTEMIAELKADPVIGALIFAENEFGAFVNQVMGIVKMTVMGETDGNCGGECGGCNEKCGQGNDLN